MRHAQEAEFDLALGSFRSALAGGALSADELVTLFTERVLVLHALHRNDAVQADLRMLATIAPDAALQDRAPRELLDAFHAVRKTTRPLVLEVTAEETATGVRLRSHVEGGEQLPSFTLRTWVRDRSGSFAALPSTDPLVAFSETGLIEYYVELVAFEGVVLRSKGTREAPNRHVRTGDQPLAAQEPGRLLAATDHSDMDARTLRRKRLVLATTVGGCLLLAGALTLWLAWPDPPPATHTKVATRLEF